MDRDLESPRPSLNDYLTMLSELTDRCADTKKVIATKDGGPLHYPTGNEKHVLLAIPLVALFLSPYK